jgi:hypothetical protein
MSVALGGVGLAYDCHVMRDESYFGDLGDRYGGREEIDILTT